MNTDYARRLLMLRVKHRDWYADHARRLRDLVEEESSGGNSPDCPVCGAPTHHGVCNECGYSYN